MKRNGFTLIEMLVAISITGVIVLVVGSSVSQILLGGPKMTERSTAITDIDSAAHWITRDLIMAQNTDLIENMPPVADMTISWSDLTAFAGDEGGAIHSIQYTLSGNQLLRNFDNEETVIARHLTNVGFSINDRIISIVMTSRSGWTNSSVTRTFSVYMRPTPES